METVRQMKGLLLPEFIARLERERNENRSDNVQRDNYHEAAVIRSGVVVDQAVHRERNSSAIKMPVEPSQRCASSAFF